MCSAIIWRFWNGLGRSDECSSVWRFTEKNWQGNTCPDSRIGYCKSSRTATTVFSSAVSISISHKYKCKSIALLAQKSGIKQRQLESTFLESPILIAMCQEQLSKQSTHTWWTAHDVHNIHLAALLQRLLTNIFTSMRDTQWSKTHIEDPNNVANPTNDVAIPALQGTTQVHAVLHWVFSSWLLNCK